MESDDGFQLLFRTTEILLEIAKFYVEGLHPYALKAQRKVAKRNRERPGRYSFHAALLSRLASLHSVLQISQNDRPQFRSSDLQTVIQQTLRTYESLLSSLETLAGSDYPHIHQLIEDHDGNISSTSNSKPPGHIYLYCPSSETQRHLQDQLLRCHTVFTRAVAVKEASDSNAFLADIDKVEEWKPPKPFTTDLTRLHSALVKHSKCICKHKHADVKAVLLTTGARGGRLSSRLVCIPSSINSVSAWQVLHLQMLDADENDSFSGRKATRVRFAEVHNEFQVHTSTAGETSFESLCQIPAIGPQLTRLCLNEVRLCGIQDQGTPAPAVLSEAETLPLSGPVPDFAQYALSDIPKKQRIALAVKLSYHFLHLSGTPWWPVREVKPAISSSLVASPHGLEVGHILLTVEELASSKTRSSPVEACINGQRPSLPALGKLLLEVWKGEKIEWSDLDSVIEECNDDFVGRYWLYAVKACLGDDLALKEAGDFRESAQLRSIFVRKVVKSLQWLLEKLCDVPVESLFVPSVGTEQNVLVDRSQIRDGVIAPTHARLEDQPAFTVSLYGVKRLINSETLELEEISNVEPRPRYAILSHRWTASEVTYTQMNDKQRGTLPSWPKIVGACKQARQDGIPFIWIDSCCINKDSSSELTQALNSMYRWYSEAVVCYVYLFDVQHLYSNKSPLFGSTRAQMANQFRESEWFSRGWTLQELLASRELKFYSADWTFVADLCDLSQLVSSITKIDVNVLTRQKAIESCSIAQRFSWAAHRETLMEEDKAYCLLGLFGVSLEAKYGIGQLAFEELQRKILDSGKADDTLYAWNSASPAEQSRFFATSPADFAGCGDIVQVQPRLLRTHWFCRSDGIGGRLGIYQATMAIDGWRGAVAMLNCRRLSQAGSLLGLCLRATPELVDANSTSEYVVTTTQTPFKEGGSRTSVPLSTRILAIDRRRVDTITLTDASIALVPPRS